MNSEEVKEIKACLDREVKDYQSEFSGMCLNYINELESENAELKKYKLDWLNGEKMHLQSEMEETEFELASSNRLFEIVSKENKQLKERIAELEIQNEVLCVELSRYTENCIEMKNGTLKQFAERLKEKCNDKNTFICSNSITATEIDETLKEMIEDDK